MRTGFRGQIVDKNKDENTKARFFPTTGGVLKTMNEVEGYAYVAIDGVENCIDALKDIGK